MNLFGKTETRKNAVVGLTTLGSTKAESIYGGEGAKAQILMMLKDAGPSSISEISDETHLSYQKVKGLVKDMISSGYIKKVGASE